MEAAVVLNRKRGPRKKRAYGLILAVLAGAAALWAMSALSRDTSAHAQAGVKGGSQPAPGLPNVPDCGLDWSVVSSPNPNSSDNELWGVAVVSASDVWAVGFYHNASNVDRTLIEHWDGTTWSMVTSPNQGTNNNELHGVAVVSANDVWAVGSYKGQTLYGDTLIEHWDGSAWSIVASPNQGTSANYLRGVAAVSATNVWAVGCYSNSSAFCSRTLTERWNGTTWNVVSSPNPGPSYNELDGVAATSGSDVWAVGNRNNSSNLTRTLIMHWNGTTWSVMSSPNPCTARNVLNGVTAISANNAWAVGSINCGTPEHTLIEHWNGTAWSVVPSANASNSVNELLGVAAASGTHVWAVGFYYPSSANVARTLIEQWDGSNWSTVYSPNRSVYENGLDGVAAISANNVWAVGDYDLDANFTARDTLVEQYNPCTGTPTPVPSACPIQYTDVTPGSTFYDYVRCLACRGIVGGYNSSPPCTTGTPCFLPGNNVTRGQMAKFISKAAGYRDVIPPNQQTFTDVPPNSTFWVYVERVYLHGVVSGYTDPARCPTGVPCFLPNNKVTRGQAANFIAKSANYQDPIPSSQQTFTDVPPSHTFWLSIERVYMHTIVSGYQNSPPCTTGTPCFLPGNKLTRGQTAKFVSKAFFPDCNTP